MANRGHLELIHKGVEAWNRWSVENPNLMPDLSRADLDMADLSTANLQFADLRDASLSGANLRGANLSGANLSRVDLHGANVSGADLHRVDLSDADLSGAELNGVDLGDADFGNADLHSANLSGADLSGAELSEAALIATVFGDTKLRDVRGLNDCAHVGPSTIDHRTLAKSSRLPIVFLRGRGLSDWQIEAAELNHELSNQQVDDILYRIALFRHGQAIQFNSCFISYSTKDQEFAERLHADLQDTGVRCWFAPHDIQGGKKIHEQIHDAIQMHDRLLLILSEASMHSEWVKTEIAKARKRESREKRRMLFPVRLVEFETLRRWECFDAEIGKDSMQEIREYYVPDFSDWKTPDIYQKELDRLLRDLKATISPGAR